jgi:multiple sugar transport system permease protein
MDTRKAGDLPILRDARQWEWRRGALRFWALPAWTPTGWPFVAPVLTLVVAAILIPALHILWLSFHESSFGLAPTYVGLSNYQRVLTDPYFWSALVNTIVVVVVIVHVELALGLGMALLFKAGVPASRFVLAAVLAPYAVSEVGAVIMWRFMLDPQIGPLTRLLELVGIPPIQWPVDPWQALGVVAIMSVWLHLPFTFIILYAARLGIPKDLYEAAIIDGATTWQSFRQVTVPLLMPAILVAVLFRYIFAFRLFSEVWLLTQGGPARTTEVVALYLYQEAFRYNDFGLASATGWLMVIAAPLMAAFYLRRMYRGIVANA